MFSNNLLNFFLNTTIINLAGSISYENYSSLICSYLKVGEGSWGKNELVESSEKGSEESVGFSDIDFTGVVHVEFSPGSWEEFGHVGFHLSFGDLFGDKEDLGASFLSSISVEDVLSGSLSSGVGDWDSVVVENVVHDIILVGTVVSR